MTDYEDDPYYEDEPYDPQEFQEEEEYPAPSQGDEMYYEDYPPIHESSSNHELDASYDEDYHGPQEEHYEDHPLVYEKEEPSSSSQGEEVAYDEDYYHPQEGNYKESQPQLPPPPSMVHEEPSRVPFRKTPKQRGSTSSHFRATTRREVRHEGYQGDTIRGDVIHKEYFRHVRYTRTNPNHEFCHVGDEQNSNQPSGQNLLAHQRVTHPRDGYERQRDVPNRASYNPGLNHKKCYQEGYQRRRTTDHALALQQRQQREQHIRYQRELHIWQQDQESRRQQREQEAKYQQELHAWQEDQKKRQELEEIRQMILQLNNDLKANRDSITTHSSLMMPLSREIAAIREGDNTASPSSMPSHAKGKVCPSVPRSGELPRPSPQGQVVKCFKCKLFGHYARECPTSCKVLSKILTDPKVEHLCEKEGPSCVVVTNVLEEKLDTSLGGEEVEIHTPTKVCEMMPKSTLAPSEPSCEASHIQRYERPNALKELYVVDYVQNNKKEQEQREASLDALSLEINQPCEPCNFELLEDKKRLYHQEYILDIPSKLSALYVYNVVDLFISFVGRSALQKHLGFGTKPFQEGENDVIRPRPSMPRITCPSGPKITSLGPEIHPFMGKTRAGLQVQELGPNFGPRIGPSIGHSQALRGPPGHSSSPDEPDHEPGPTPRRRRLPDPPRLNLDPMDPATWLSTTPTHPMVLDHDLSPKGDPMELLRTMSSSRFKQRSFPSSPRVMLQGFQELLRVLQPPPKQAKDPTTIWGSFMARTSKKKPTRSREAFKLTRSSSRLRQGSSSPPSRVLEQGSQEPSTSTQAQRALIKDPNAFKGSTFKEDEKEKNQWFVNHCLRSWGA